MTLVLFAGEGLTMVRGETGLDAIKGIGPKKFEGLKRLGLTTVSDLATNYPSGYIDRRHLLTLPLVGIEEEGTLEVHVKSLRFKTRQRLLLVGAESDGWPVSLVFFNAQYLRYHWQEGKTYLVHGLLKRRGDEHEMAHPEFCEVTDPQAREAFLEVTPKYPATEGLGQKDLVKLHRILLELEIPETLPRGIRSRHGLMGRQEAIRQIHFPSTDQALVSARRRLIFEELLDFILPLQLMKAKRRKIEGRTLSLPDAFGEQMERLPFALTGAQATALEAVVDDVTKGRRMHRLLQGDVGSGKTIVAFLAMYLHHLNGLQSLMMAPTELLAEQHAVSFGRFFPSGTFVVESLTSSTKGKEALLERVRRGEVHALIGTHALLQEHVVFQRLGLVVTDEQHRFGVDQREAVAKKDDRTNVLVMSATPIPRTLSMTLYGDLDVSIIDERPAGRQDILTYYVPEKKREGMYGFIAKKLDAGERAFFVCPAIESSEAFEVTSVMDHFAFLSEGPFSRYRVGMVHGRMRSEEKEQIMAAFARGELDVLVATTVIEVGIDVPEASVMVIENAERFGLAQLHQLRGRVGRGTAQGYCFLLADQLTENAKERLKMMVKSQDGFELAEADLRLRGPGDVFGTRQSGIFGFRLTDLSRDRELLEEVQGEVASLLRRKSLDEMETKYLEAAERRRQEATQTL